MSEQGKDAERLAPDERPNTLRESVGFALAFHDHLGECVQCRDHPFALCPTGATLLENAALAHTDQGAR